MSTRLLIEQVIYQSVRTFTSAAVGMLTQVSDQFLRQFGVSLALVTAVISTIDLSEIDQHDVFRKAILRAYIQ